MPVTKTIQNSGVRSFGVLLWLLLSSLILHPSSFSLAASLWGWHGGNPVAPEHVSKQMVSQASWAGVPCFGSMVYTSKNAVADWSRVDRDVFGWKKLGVKVILQTAFHPAGLADHEVMPFRVGHAQAVLQRYCNPASSNYANNVVAIEPTNEPWIDNDDVAKMWDAPSKTFRWGYVNNRLGVPLSNTTFGVGGAPGPTTNSLVVGAVAWLKSLAYLHASVRTVAKPLGIKVYGPHWQSPLYDAETRVAAQCGLLDSIDVFTFGCDAATPNWWALLAPLKQVVGDMPTACTEFHLFHAPRGKPDIEHALEIKNGLRVWREGGVQFVLLHPGLADWVSTDTTDAPGGWRSMAQYIDGKPSHCLSAVMAEMSAGGETRVLVPAWTNAPTINLTCPTIIALPIILESEIDALWGLSAADSRAVVAYLRAKGIAR